MSGHSKWSTIKRKKEATDSKRGQIFTRLIREITIAAKIGGKDPDNNSRLRTAIEAAKSQNMPKENIDRAIKKGTGELESITYEEVTYEGYAPGGVAILIEVITDNKKRTTAEIRHILSKHGGSLAKTGSVGYLFETKGILNLNKNCIDENKLMEIILEAGADDIKDEGDIWEIYCHPDNINIVSQALTLAKLNSNQFELTKIPLITVKITDPNEASKILKIINALDDHIDIHHFYANFDIDIDNKKLQKILES